jgi:carbon storage regulator
MLVLTRRCGEKVCIGNDITFVVLEVNAQRVRVGIDAPRQVPILRAELQGKMANTLAGKPEPFFGLGNEATTSAPNSGT